MSNCEGIRELLVLHAEGVLAEGQSRLVTEHLAVCPSCREETESIGRIRKMLADPEVFAPETSYAWQMLPQALAARLQAQNAPKSRLPVNFGRAGWVLSLAATVVLCFGLVWMTHRQPTGTPAASVQPAPGNAAFLGKIQTAYAREATAKYLSECQDLLLDVMRAEKNCEGGMYDVSLEVERARRLLQRKQMLEAELVSPAIAPARELCNELERFLVNLSTSDKCEGRDRIHRMERFIQREQLLLRINVVQSELS